MGSISKTNPTHKNWAPMKLYLESQVGGQGHTWVVLSVLALSRTGSISTIFEMTSAHRDAATLLSVSSIYFSPTEVRGLWN